MWMILTLEGDFDVCFCFSKQTAKLKRDKATILSKSSRNVIPDLLEHPPYFPNLASMDIAVLTAIKSESLDIQM
jgi:hypothetical protein